MAGKTRFAGYLKDEFGRVSLTAINKLAVLTLLRKFEDEGKLETRDRVRSKSSISRTWRAPSKIPFAGSKNSWLRTRLRPGPQ